MQVRHLTANMRARGDAAGQQEWRAFLLQVGDGTVPVHRALSPYAIRLPDALCAPADWTSKELVEFSDNMGCHVDESEYMDKPFVFVKVFLMGWCFAPWIANTLLMALLDTLPLTVPVT